MGQNATTVEGAYAAFGKGDIPGVIGMLADDVDWSAPATLPHGGHFHGQDGVGKFFEGLGATWSALPLTVESITEAGADNVIAVVRADGTRTDGSADGYGAVHIFTLANGKVARFREYVDIDAPIT
jgi:ketosteroid isomerase-like protein